MSDTSETNARHAAMLGRLAELGLALAADLQRRALAAEDDNAAGKLADSFHKVGRSVRQTLALEAKLNRDHAAAAREAVAENERTRPLRIAKRQVAVREQVARLIWTEIEGDEDARFAIEMLADLVGHGAELDDDFLDVSLETIVQRIRDRIFQELANYRAEGDLYDTDEDDGGEQIEGDFSPEPELRRSG